MKTLLVAALIVGAMGTSTMAQENRIDRVRPDAPELAAPGQTAMARLQALETQVEGMAAEIERLGAIVAQLHADLGVE